MTAPVDTSGQVYADFAGLDALKKSAANRDPTALRAVAKQFESLFARMMIKSMRDASGTDPVFGSDQQKMYEGMYDDQLSLELTRGRGLGLADMLVRQLQRLSGSGATTGTSAAGGATSSDGAKSVPQAAPATPAQQKNFISSLWPAAQAAGEQLGTDPRNLIAQAALETGWGRNIPRDGSGGSSYNLFGMKASASWSGATVDAPTVEYRDGSPISTSASFRSYGSTQQSVHDYVALMRTNPRYAAALNTGSDAQAFGAALQRGGYATDPAYASKLSAIAARLRDLPQDSLKLASAVPITAGTGSL